MHEQFAEVAMKRVVQPAGGLVFESDGPVNHGEAAIEFGGESGKMMPIRLLGERDWFHGTSVAAFGRNPQIKNQKFVAAPRQSAAI